MFDWIILGIAIGLGGGAESAPATPKQTEAPALMAEPQVPSGKFTTATEVKPILTMTKGNWVALREYDGQDLLYVTHLYSWRCGLLAMKIGINDAPMQDWPLPACHTDTATPNAITAEDGLPFESFGLGSVDTVRVEITYDDLSTDSAEFSRAAIVMP